MITQKAFRADEGGAPTLWEGYLAISPPEGNPCGDPRIHLLGICEYIAALGRIT